MQKSPHVTILILHGHSHLTYLAFVYLVVPSTMQKSHCVTILTSHDNCHLTSTLCPPHVPLCQVVPSTMQKSPHMTILTSCGNCHLMSTSHALMLSCPLHHTKVTSCDHSHLAWQLSPCVHLMYPCVELSPPPYKSHIV